MCRFKGVTKMCQIAPSLNLQNSSLERHTAGKKTRKMVRPPDKDVELNTYELNPGKRVSVYHYA